VDIVSNSYDAMAPNVTTGQRLAYSAIVTEDLLLRDLPADAHGNKGKENALFLFIDAVPCILYLESRVSLKLMTTLLINGLSNA
jgi:hypothetical protein